MPIVFLDRQHTGKPGKWTDSGCTDGVHQEIYLTQKYITAAEMRLRSRGVDVCTISDGLYSDRHQRVNAYSSTHKVSIYVACHINAGGGSYAAVFYDGRSMYGQKLATEICDSLSTIDALPKRRAEPCRVGDWTEHAYNTIRGVGQPIGICFEPSFIDCASHKDLLSDQGLTNIGNCLADGIINYINKLQSK